MSETKQNIEEFLFDAAVQKTDAAERAAFLDGVCRNNPVLRARLEVLLEGHFVGDGFLTSNPERSAPTVRVETPKEAPAQTAILILPREGGDGRAEGRFCRSSVGEMRGRRWKVGLVGEGGWLKVEV